MMYSGEVSLNQVGAVSTLHISGDKPVATRTRGIRTRILCGQPERIAPDAPDRIELNGMSFGPNFKVTELTLVFDRQ